MIFLGMMIISIIIVNAMIKTYEKEIMSTEVALPAQQTLIQEESVPEKPTQEQEYIDEAKEIEDIEEGRAPALLLH